MTLFYGLRRMPPTPSEGACMVFVNMFRKDDADRRCRECNDEKRVRGMWKCGRCRKRKPNVEFSDHEVHRRKTAKTGGANKRCNTCFREHQASEAAVADFT